MKLIVGLGNPGEKYEHTRHNLGFMVVEQFLKDFHAEKDTSWSDEKKFKADISLLTWQPKQGEAVPLILAKPKTFMNNSGLTVSLISAFYKIAPEDVWVVNDELDLPFGSMKLRFGGAIL
jgi:PTH1 family peptidyl-tRNA hydrolase